MPNINEASYGNDFQQDATLSAGPVKVFQYIFNISNSLEGREADPAAAAARRPTRGERRLWAGGGAAPRVPTPRPVA